VRRQPELVAEKSFGYSNSYAAQMAGKNALWKKPEGKEEFLESKFDV
jgi:hypothetical protein